MKTCFTIRRHTNSFIAQSPVAENEHTSPVSGEVVQRKADTGSLLDRLTASDAIFRLSLSVSVALSLLICFGIYRLATADTPITSLIGVPHAIKSVETKVADRVKYDPDRYIGFHGTFETVR